MSGKTIFWTCVAVYWVAVAVKFVIVPAIRRWEQRKIGRMSVSEYKRYLKYINY